MGGGIVRKHHAGYLAALHDKGQPVTGHFQLLDSGLVARLLRRGQHVAG
jgi:hypothetical protein